MLSYFEYTFVSEGELKCQTNLGNKEQAFIPTRDDLSLYTIISVYS